MAELVDVVKEALASELYFGEPPDVDVLARAAIRATLEEAIERVRPHGYRSEDLFPSGEWSGRVQAVDILRDMLAALDG